jgi:hypothetical protein
MRIAVFSLVVLALAATSSARAESAPAADAHPLTVAVGGSVAICQTGTIVCPAAAPICDDLSIAVPDVDPERGLVFRGKKPGQTLCSASSALGQGLRAVYRVTVR